MYVIIYLYCFRGLLLHVHAIDMFLHLARRDKLFVTMSTLTTALVHVLPDKVAWINKPEILECFVPGLTDFSERIVVDNGCVDALIHRDRTRTISSANMFHETTLLLTAAVWTPGT